MKGATSPESFSLLPLCLLSGCFVPPHRSAAALRVGLDDSSNRDVTIRILLRASHVFTTGGLAEPIVANYPTLLVRWLKQRVLR